jgi:inorganic pyrophosphatase
LPVDTLKPGTNAPYEVNVVVEIPKGSTIKYEIDPKNGRTSVDRILFPAMFYPYNYGFIPQTKEEIPKGSTIKYEIDPKNGRTSVDRILFPAMFYPYNYGFIPQTKEEQPGHNGEADPIDVFVLGNYSLWPVLLV